MSGMLTKMAVYLGSSALGILVASVLVPGFSVRPLGFIVAVIVFSLAQAALTPLIEKAVAKHAAALTGGVGLISTFVALFVSHLFVGGMRIWGVTAWISATLIVWLVTALATWLLPHFVGKSNVSAD